MTHVQNIAIFLLRVSLGWMMFYAGITKVFDPSWSAAGYLRSAKTFPLFYQWLTEPALLPVVDFLNEWGLTLLGMSLMLGIGVRLSSLCGALLMLLYYFPILSFPYPNLQSYIVDQHIIYIAVLLVLGAIRAGRVWGLEEWCAQLPICRQFPHLRRWIG